MAWDGNGNFLRVMDWTNDASAGIKIRADRHDTEDDNFAQGIGNALTKDGQSTPTANISMNGFKLINLGAPTTNADAVTKAYVDALKTFTKGLDLSGNNADGRLTFSGTQTADTDAANRPLGLGWTQSDLFFGVKPNANPESGDVPRFIWNSNATGTGTDLMTLTEAGVLTINKTASGSAISLISTEASASSGPNIGTYRRNANAAASDQLGCWVTYGRNVADADVMYTSIYNYIVDPTTNSVDGRMSLRVAVNNVMTTRIMMDDTGTTFTGKVISGDIDGTNMKSIGGFTVERTDEGAASGPAVLFDRISTTPAANDQLATLYFRGRDSTASGTDPNIGVTDYAFITSYIIDPANNSEAGNLRFAVKNGAGSNFYGVIIDGTAGDNKVIIAGLQATNAQLTTPTFIAQTSTVATFQMTDAGAGAGPILTIERISTSPAAGDGTGSIYFRGRDTGNAVQDYCRILSSIDTATAGAEDGRLNFQVVRAGTITSVLQIGPDETSIGGYLRVTSGYAGGTSAYLGSAIGTGASGSVVLRPQGITSSTGQVTFNSAGDITLPGVVNADSYFVSTDTICVLAATGAGTIYLRPNGSASTSGEFRLDTAGGVVMNGSITSLGAGAIIKASDGLVIAGPTSASSANVNPGVVLSDQGYIYSKKAGTTNQTHLYFINNCAVTPASVGEIRTNGSATEYRTSSDENLKTFIGEYDPLKAIDIIRRDPVRDFNWISDGQYAVGWGAQTSHAVSPDLGGPPSAWVFDPETPEITVAPQPGQPGYQPWGIDQGKRTPYLWAALTWALDRIDELMADVAALKGATA